MVRADTFDGIDQTLTRVRKNPEAFGGVLFDNFKFYQEGDLLPSYTEEGFVISPNPVDNLLRVKSANLDEAFDVQIFDQMGRLITRKADNQNIAMINLAEAAQGIYFVTIIKSGEHVSTEKFIKL